MDGESTPDQGSDPDHPPPAPDHPPPANASRRQMIRNVLTQYATFFISILMTLVLTRVLLRQLGPATYGLWIVLLAIVGYVGLLDVGVATAAVQRIARLTADNDRDGVDDVMRTAWWFFSVSGVLAMLITWALAPFLSSFLNLGTINPSVAGTTLILLGGMLVCMFLASVPNAVLFGSGRSDRLAQIGLLVLFFTQAGQIVVVLAGGNLIGMAIVSVVGFFLGLVIAASLVGRITRSSIRRGHFDRTLLVELLRFGGRQAVIALSTVVAYQLDALIIGWILPVAQVAPYDIALNTANLTRNLSTQGTNLLIPTYAHFETVGNHERQAWFFFRSVLVALAISVPFVIALAAFGEPILQLWLGKVPPKTYEIVIVFGFVTTLQLPGAQCFGFLTGVGRNRLLARLALIGAVVNLAGSIAATFWWGPVGPAIGSLPVVLVIDFVVLPMIVCRYLDAPFARYLRTALAPVVPAAAVAGITAIAMLILLPTAHGFGAVVEAGIVLAVSWMVMIAVLFRIEPDFRNAAMRLIAHRGRRVTPPGPGG